MITAIDFLELIKVSPAKPTASTIKYLDAIKNQIEIEFKEDGIRAIIFKDPDGYYRALSSSGSPLGGNFTNIFSQLESALDDSWVFSGEVYDSLNLDDRGSALSVAKNNKYPPDRIFMVMWNAFKLTPEMIQKGEISPDSGPEVPNYKEMRLNLLNILRTLRPKQIKSSRRFKMTGDMTIQQVFDTVMKMGGEGIVAKYKTGGKPMLKIKGLDFGIFPLMKFNISSSSSFVGQVTSLDVKIPSTNKIFTVGQGYDNHQKTRLTKLMTDRHGDSSNLWVGTAYYKPTKPLPSGGSPSWAQFRFISSDLEGNNKLVECIK